MTFSLKHECKNYPCKSAAAEWTELPTLWFIALPCLLLSWDAVYHGLKGGCIAFQCRLYWTSVFS